MCRREFTLHKGAWSIKEQEIKMADKKMATDELFFDVPVKPGYHRVELLRAVWDLPVRYQDIQPIGTGAYGSVM